MFYSLKKKLDVAEDLKREESYILVLSLFTLYHPFMDTYGEGKPGKRDICSQLVTDIPVATPASHADKIWWKYSR